MSDRGYTTFRIPQIYYATMRLKYNMFTRINDICIAFQTA